MNNYHNASPITQSIFTHCNPLENTRNNIEKELRDENLIVNRQTQEDRSKEPLLPSVTPN
jgi:hypothetical protein